jgi:hypothetical protein
MSHLVILVALVVLVLIVGVGALSEPIRINRPNVRDGCGRATYPIPGQSELRKEAQSLRPFQFHSLRLSTGIAHGLGGLKSWSGYEDAVGT